MQFSLRTKLLFSVGIINLVVLGTSTFIHTQQLKRDYLEAIEWRSEALSNGLIEAVPSIKTMSPSADFQSTLRAFSVPCNRLYEANKEKNVAHVAVIDATGVIVAHNDATFWDTPITSPILLAHLNRHQLTTVLDGATYHTLTPISGVLNVYLGAIDIGIPKAAVDRKVRQLFIDSVGVFGIFLIVAFMAISLLMSMLVVKPIERLMVMMKAIEGGNFDIQAQRTVNDELGKLAGAFNRMGVRLKESFQKRDQLLAELKEKQEALQTLNQELEQRVTARTAELTRQTYILDTFMENVPDNIYFKDRESRFIRVNKALAELFGLRDASEAVGKTDFDFFPEEQAHMKYRQELEIIQSGQPILAMEEPNSQGQWVLTTKMPLRDEHNTIIGTFGISRDITHLKQAQRALEQAYAEIVALNQRLQDDNLRYYLKSLLVSAPPGTPAGRFRLELTSTWNKKYFAVVLFKLLPGRRSSADRAATDSADPIHLLLPLLQESVEQASISGIITPLTTTETALILNVDDAAVMRAFCDLIVGKYQELALAQEYTLIVGIGKAASASEHLHDSYETARQALNARRNRAVPQIIVYDEIQPSGAEVILNDFPFAQEQTFITAVAGGQPATVAQIMAELIEENRLEQSNYQKLAALYDRFLRTAGKMLAQAPIPEANLLEDLLLSAFRRPRPETIPELQERLEDLFRAMTAIYARHNQQRPEILKTQLLRYLDDHYADRNLSLENLAEVFKLHPNYLSTYFKAHTGMNYVDYLAILRVKHAKDLLISAPNQAIREISAQIGFFNEATFIRVFKRFEGITPGAYRQRELSIGNNSRI